MIVSTRNAGLGDNLLAAASAWLYAQRTGRALAICWFHARYVRDARDNAFTHLFDIPEELAGVPVIHARRVDHLSAFLLSFWSYLFPWPDVVEIARRALTARGGPRLFPRMVTTHEKRLQREMTAVYTTADLPGRLVIASACYSGVAATRPFYDALRLQPRLARQVEEFAARHFHGRTVIGAHIRYYDPALPFSHHTAYWTNPEQALAQCVEMIAAAMRQTGAAHPLLFLATDSQRVHDHIHRHVDHVVSWPKPFGASGARELHQEIPVETAEASVIEMFLLARCQLLFRYPPDSWFSHYASLSVPMFGN
ncbi:MAG: nodulation protein NodZ [Blastocatellia bacterium]